MDKAAVINATKKNIFSLACVGVVVVALVAIYVWPVPSLRADLEANLAQSKKLAQDIQSAVNRSPNAPIIDPMDDEPKPLDGFPRSEQLEAALGAVRQLENQSQEALNHVVELNRRGKNNTRQVLTGQPADALGSVSAINFRDTYPSRFDNTHPDSIARRILNGTRPPAAADLEAEMQRIVEEESTRLYTIPGQTTAANAEEVEGNIARRQAAVPLRLQKERAANHAVYVEPMAFKPFPAIQVAINDGVQPDDTDIFNAQIWLWVQEELAYGIAELNKGIADLPAGADDASSLDRPFLSVPQALVKHVIDFQILHSPYGSADGNNRGGRTGMPGSPDEMPAEMPLQVNAAAPITRDFEMSPTGRASNSFFDAVQWRLRIRTDASSVPKVLAHLGDNRMVTPLNVNLQSVDAAVAFDQGYIYGEEPVVELDIIGETLFLRTWMHEVTESGRERSIIPEEIRQMLAAASMPRI